MIGPNYLIRKFTGYFLLVIFTFVFSGVIFSQTTENDNAGDVNFYNVVKQVNDAWNGKEPAHGGGWKPFKRMEYFWGQRLYPTGKVPDPRKIYSDYKIYEQKLYRENRVNGDADWKFIGKTQMPEKHYLIPESGMGRVNCLAIDPTDDNILWAGASFGGVWKSTDDGDTWRTFDFTNFMSIGISDIKVSKSNPDVVYAATGDANGAGVLGTVQGYSIGMIKTTDGGETWELAGLSSEIVQKMLINTILINPDNPNIVYAGTNTGLFKTSDGGKNWTQLIKDRAVRHMVFKPDDPNIIYCATYKMQMSYPYSFTIDTWNDSEGMVMYSKNIGNNIARIVLAVTPDNPSIAYALIARYQLFPIIERFHSVIKTGNMGSSWVDVNYYENSPDYLATYVADDNQPGQGLYDLAFAVSPVNENELYLGGVNIWKSTNGGVTFNVSTSAYEEENKIYPWVHADCHMLVYNSKGDIYSTNDGGVNKSTDEGITWDDLSDGLQITCYYSVSVSRDSKNLILTGAQDNSSNLYADGKWKTVTGGDGMMCKIDQTNSSYMYSSSQRGYFYHSTNGGVSFETMLDRSETGESASWVAPIEIDPKNPYVIYTGYQNIYKSTDRGSKFDKLTAFDDNQPITVLKVAPSDPNIIYAAKYSTLYASFNGGVNWNEISNPGQVITDIAIDPGNPYRMWFTLSGYSSNKKVYEFKTSSVKNVSSGLPNVPVNTIVYQNDSPDRLYIGTDVGVFYSEGSNRVWKLFNDGLPNVVVNDLEIHETTKSIIAATYGRGLWESKLISCDIEAPVVFADGSAYESRIEKCEGDTVILEVQGNYAKYEWSNGRTGKSIAVTKDGIYSVKVTDTKNCVAETGNINVSFQQYKNIEIKSLNDLPVCEGDSVLLRASLGFTNYAWSDGSEGMTITVWEPGKYTCIGTTSAGCESVSDTFEVTMVPKPDKPSITQEGDTLFSSQAAAYKWYKDGKEISGADKQYYVPAGNANYSVEVFNEQNCSNMSDGYDFSTGVEELMQVADYLMVHPNPTNGSFVIESYLKKPMHISITVSTYTGEQVLKKDYDNVSGNFSANFDLSAKSSGIYLVTIEVGKVKVIRKVVRQ